MKKIFIVLLSAVAALGCALALTACSKHKHEYSAEIVPPTCTEQGYTLYTCACGNSYKDSYVDATGHDYAEVTTVDPDCTEKGYTLHTCACGASYMDEEVDALGHTVVIDEAVEADCTNSGLTEGKHCSVCGTVLVEQKTIPAGHYLIDGRCQYCGMTVPTAGLEYRLNRDGISYSVYGIGSAKDTYIVIPEEYEGLPVTAIGSRAFEDCKNITGVIIPDGVTEIGRHAFEGCSGIKSVSIPESITSIGEDAFRLCGSLTAVNISDLKSWCGISFEYAGANPLSHAKNLYLNNQLVTELVIPEGITSISDYAFCGCDSITRVTLYKDITSIGVWAFSQCENLTEVTIFEGVTAIGYSAFMACLKLTSITIPKSVISVGDYAFGVCFELKSVTIAEGVTSVGEAAFLACRSLTEITIPKSVTFIGEEVLAYCDGLESITVASGNTAYHSDGNCLIETASKTLIAGCKNSIIPDDGSVTKIGVEAFYLCSGLTDITLPNCITEIGNEAFAGCTGLESITVASGNTVYHSSGNCLIETASNTLIAGCKNSVIPADGSVTKIAWWAFSYNGSLTSIAIPKSVTEIGGNAFYGCSNLTDIYYEGSEEDWANIAMGGGNYLTNATIHYNYNG